MHLRFGKFINRLNRDATLINQRIQQSSFIMRNGLLCLNPGSGLRNVINTLDIIGNTDAAVITSILAIDSTI